MVKIQNNSLFTMIDRGCVVLLMYKYILIDYFFGGIIMARAINVARYVISLNREEEFPKDLTNLKMQKLLYYCFGIHRLNFEEDLFNEAILAWRLGPVVKEVYDKYKVFGYSDLKDPFPFFDYNLTDNEIDTITEVWNFFKDVPANMLVDMTHSETPWIDAWNNQQSEIDKKIIEDYFRQNYATV